MCIRDSCKPGQTNHKHCRNYEPSEKLFHHKLTSPIYRLVFYKCQRYRQRSILFLTPSYTAAEIVPALPLTYIATISQRRPSCRCSPDDDPGRFRLRSSSCYTGLAFPHQKLCILTLLSLLD